MHLTKCSTERISQLIKAFRDLGDSHIISTGVYVSFSSSVLISAFSLSISFLKSPINSPSTCIPSSLNRAK
ncbi:TPA: hypothetical protein DEG21_01220 [Patescibacteria group bacterium]|nr:hypothetical protein [Candidatus Gracilibacteria bacterium]